MRFGAPVTFNSLLYEIDVYAAGATSPQDTFTLSFEGSDSEMHRPLLMQISQTVPLQPSRVLRVFTYGKRNLQFGDVQSSNSARVLFRNRLQDRSEAGRPASQPPSTTRSDYFNGGGTRSPTPP